MSLEDEIKKIDDAIKELSAEQAYLVRSGGVPSQEISNAIQDLTARKMDRQQRLQQEKMSKNVVGNMSVPKSGSAVKYGLIVIAALLIFTTILPVFGIPVLETVWALPQLEGAREGLSDVGGQVNLLGCRLGTYSHLDLWSNPTALDALYKTECLKQSMSVTKESYKNLLKVNYNLDSYTEPGRKFFGEIVFEPDQLKDNLKVELKGVSTAFTNIGQSKLDPYMRGEYPEPTNPVTTHVLKVSAAGCTDKTPCIFVEDQKGETKKTTLNFEWLGNMVNNKDKTGYCDVQNISSIKSIVIVSYDYRTTSMMSKIIVSDKKVPEPSLKTDIYGPVSAVVEGLSGNVVTLNENPEQNNMRLNIIIKNSGTGDAKLKRLEVESKHDSNIPELIFDECSITKDAVPIIDGKKGEGVSFTLGDTNLEANKQNNMIIACNVKYQNVVGEYTLTPIVEYSYDIPLEKTAVVTYETCPTN